jgi:hypothetical protein
MAGMVATMPGAGKGKPWAVEQTSLAAAACCEPVLFLGRRPLSS